MTGLDPVYLESIAKRALAEDIGSGDVTTLITIPENSVSAAEIVAKEPGVIAGMPVALAVFRAMDADIEVLSALEDGAEVNPGDVIAALEGGTRSLLTSERTALNFLQRLSGIATGTAKLVRLVSHTRARILDTRKTTPGLRRLEKYAVTVGGGCNHRFGLSDGILIKNNHIAAAGGVAAAVTAAKKRAPHGLKIEVEVTSMGELSEAIDAGADAVLLDNMTPDQMRQAVEAAGGRVLLEASGSVNESNAAGIAETGVDLISVGALTHSPRALDISMGLHSR